MGRRPVDTDPVQRFIDRRLSPNRYRLDTRFVLRDGERHPFAVLCPGGAYRRVCSYIEGVPLARQLNALGISAFIVYYRVGRRGRFPHPLEDLARAVREILGRAEEYGVEPGNYSVWGSSAGGHLAACFGSGSLGWRRFALPRPGALVLSYPVISLEREITHRVTRDTLLGRGADEETARRLSADRLVTAEYPPCYLWTGEADASVPPENSRRMAAALERAGVPFRFALFPGVGHGVGPGTGTAAEGWIRQAADFWLGREKS